MAHDVFISHAAENRSAAETLCRVLEENGVRCWIAPRDILPGESFADAILKGIAHARMMVVVFSLATNSSRHVPREVERAAHRGLPIAPIRIQDAEPTGDLEYFLSSSHRWDALAPPLPAHFQKFAKQLRTRWGWMGRL